MRKQSAILLTAAIIALSPAAAFAEQPAQKTQIEKLDRETTGTTQDQGDCSRFAINCLGEHTGKAIAYPEAPAFPQYGI